MAEGRAEVDAEAGPDPRRHLDVDRRHPAGYGWCRRLRTGRIRGATSDHGAFGSNPRNATRIWSARPGSNVPRAGGGVGSSAPPTRRAGLPVCPSFRLGGLPAGRSLHGRHPAGGRSIATYPRLHRRSPRDRGHVLNATNPAATAAMSASTQAGERTAAESGIRRGRRRSRRRGSGARSVARHRCARRVRSGRSGRPRAGPPRCSRRVAARPRSRG